MDAKEKADSLIAQYLLICQYKMGMDREYVLGKAKECALVAVDEIIKVLDVICERASYDPFEAPMVDLKEWQQVKQEIEKL